MSKTERFQKWTLSGLGQITGRWPIAEGLYPDAFVELTYNDKGLLVAIREQLEGHAQPIIRRPTFDAKGRLKQSERTGPDPATRMKNSYTYASSGLLSERQEADLDSGALVVRITSKCDKVGNFLDESLFDPQKRMQRRWVRKFDNQNRLIREEVHVREASEQDAADKKNEIAYTGFFSMEYDDAGHEVRRVWHNAEGKEVQVRTAKFDEHDRYVELSVQPASGKPTFEFRTYGPNGRIITKEYKDAEGKLLATSRPGGGGTWWKQSSLPGPKAPGGLQPKKAPEIKPELRDAMLVIAHDHTKQGRFDEALKLYQDVAASDPDDVRILFSVGACALACGKLHTALNWFDRALMQDPSDEQSLKGKEQVQKALQHS